MMLLLQEAAASEVQSTATGHFELAYGYSLANPWALLLILLAIPMFGFGRSKRGIEAGRVATMPGATMPRSLVQRLAWIPGVLHFLSLCLVAIGLARPLKGTAESISVSEGVDIVLLIDRSSSMQHEDLARGRNRLEVVKQVVGDFAVRRMTDREGAADSVCLISFARYPKLLCPFTLDVDAVTGFLEGVELVRDRAEDGTGIGIALAKSVAVLRETEAESKVCVLLTDGENNIDLIAPKEAAELAAEEGIRVYTVLAGRYQFQQDFFGNIVATEQEIDATELKDIASMTGGRFFRAKDKAGLEAVYAEIEELERTEREELDRAEHFDRYPPWVLAGLASYLLAWLFRSTWARRLP